MDHGRNTLKTLTFSQWISSRQNIHVLFSSLPSTVNKHKPWIETSYHGVITENTDVVLLDPPLVALDKDAPVPYAGKTRSRSGIASCPLPRFIRSVPPRNRQASNY